MACTTILVGRKASYDGSTMIARNDDSGSGHFTPKKFVVVPPQEHPAVYRSVLSHVEVELPGSPMRMTAMPNAVEGKGIWAAGGVNEAGVGMTATETITSNPRVLGADPLVEYIPAKDGQPEVPGGIGEEDIVYLVLPYIHTAREGVLRLGKLLEKYGTYEMNGIAFQDVHEIWWLETIGVLMMIVGSVMYLPQGRERQAFAMLNASGCNIGNFAMPFAQGFLGPVGVIAVSLFDCGNSMICLGGAYSIASIVKSGDGKFRIKPILNNLVHSIPLMTYIFMTILGLLHLSLPAPVVEFAGIVGNANAFMAMLMIGVGFHLNGDPSQIGDIIKILGVRYIIGIALALAAYFILPLPLEYRQALVIVFLAPVASANPPFTAQMGSDFGLASAINSVSIIASIVLITTALVIML